MSDDSWGPGPWDVSTESTVPDTDSWTSGSAFSIPPGIGEGAVCDLRIPQDAWTRYDHLSHLLSYYPHIMRRLGEVADRVAARRAIRLGPTTQHYEARLRERERVWLLSLLPRFELSPWAWQVRAWDYAARRARNYSEVRPFQWDGQYASVALMLHTIWGTEEKLLATHIPPES